MSDTTHPLVYIILVVMFCVAIISTAFAHDHDPEIDHWLRGLMQPDNPRMPCCGPSDAYWADEVHVRDGKVYATITDDRDDGAPLYRHHVPMGKVIEVPPEKLTWKDGNPSGHVVIFLNVNDDVLCYVQNGGF